MNGVNNVNRLITGFASMAILACGCDGKRETAMEKYEKRTFGYDVQYLSEKDQVIILKSDDGNAQVLVSPGYQAKVFTSTAAGMEGPSIGYLNYEALDSDEIDEHMNGYGGENRLWLGPEGGRFSIYFKPGVEQEYANWHTPKPFDIEAWEVVSSSTKSVHMKKDMQLANYIGTRFHLAVDRRIDIVEPSRIASLLDITIDQGVKSVGYLTENSITNLDSFAWTPESGTVCIWMLDMYDPAPDAVTVVPFKEGGQDSLGKIATTDYFGEIPADRLSIDGNVLYLKTDGNYRSKLGMTARRTASVAANYNPEANLLTLTTFSVDEDAVYLNQEWNPDKDPLAGDAMNAYNDGPLDDGSIMGPFLELESVSPAAFLQPGQTLAHHHNVFHFIGDEESLSRITEKALGVSIEKIKSMFSKSN